MNLTFKTKGLDCILQSNDNILVVNQTTLARFLSNGTFDTSFNTTGVATPSGGTLSVAGIQSTGNIIVAGYQTGTNTTFYTARYTTAGVIDSTFGTGGVVTTLIGEGCSINSIQIQSDDSIVVAGGAVISGTPNIALVRYTANGTIDNTFGTSGIVTTLINNVASLCYDISLQINGDIVAGGMSANTVAVARYTSTGVLDSTFGTGGIVTTTIGTNSGAQAVTIQTTGEIVIGGISDDNIVLVRYTSSGSLDTTFGVGGIVVSSLGQINNVAKSIELQADGNILIVGSIDSRAAVVRYTTNGSIDTTYGNNGIQIRTNIESSTWNDIVLQTDGKSIVVGANEEFLMTRLTTTGDLDMTFGNSAIMEFSSAAPCAQAIVSSGSSSAISTSTTGTDIVFTSLPIAVGCLLNATNDALIIQVTGIYEITYTAQVSWTTSFANVSVIMLIGGVFQSESQCITSLTASSQVAITHTFISNFTVDDAVSFRISSSSSGQSLIANTGLFDGTTNPQFKVVITKFI